MPFDVQAELPAVLPSASTGSVRLGPVQCLELAALGAAARGLISLDALVDTVWCLYGRACPERSIVHCTIQRLVAQGALTAHETWIASMPFQYAATVAGARRLRELMAVPLHRRCDADARDAASIKLGLLDFLDREEARRVILDLRDSLAAAEAELDALGRRVPSGIRSLGLALEQRRRLNRQRLADLDACLERIDASTSPATASVK